MTGGWRRSSYCAGDACLWLTRRDDDGRIALAYGSENGPHTHMGLLTPSELAAFIKGVRAGEFDDLTGETP
jgi:hypothetical protein